MIFSGVERELVRTALVELERTGDRSVRTARRKVRVMKPVRHLNAL